IIVGGGVSKSHARFLPLLCTRAELKPAKLLNNAGIVGAAMIAVNDGKAKVKKSESKGSGTPASGAIRCPLLLTLAGSGTIMLAEDIALSQVGEVTEAVGVAEVGSAASSR